MNETYRNPAAMLCSLAALSLAVTVPSAWADDDDEEIPFDEAFIFFELNYTDQDLGIHAKVDGDAWKRLKIKRDDNNRKLLDIRVRSRLRQQGLTELFFESAEPEFDDLSPADFFARFPEGDYDIEGRTLDGKELESETEITHKVPAPAVTMINGMASAEDCDADLPVFAPGTLMEITWEEVTHSVNPLDEGFADFPPSVPINVVNYEVVAEIDESPYKVSAILPPDARSFVIPAEIVALGDEIKYEVLVREESYNQTAVESCFEVVDDP